MITTLTQDGNTYQVLRITEMAGGKKEFSIVWGKTDLRCILGATEEGAVLDDLKIKRGQDWFAYCKVSGHGSLREETLWRNAAGEELYVELPHKLKKNLLQVCVRADRFSGDQQGGTLQEGELPGDG